jgi:Leucine-rich repeat (LRR) protein
MVNFCSIYGSGAADVLSSFLPLPKLEILSISGSVPNKDPLPTIPSLTVLHVATPNAMEVIKNNTHITGSLSFGVHLLDEVCDRNTDISGIEKFTSIQYLRPPSFVQDISPISGCTELRILDLSYSYNIDSLKPLYGLENLQEIMISGSVYYSLPNDERQRFTPDNNRDASAVHVYLDTHIHGHSEITTSLEEGRLLRVSDRRIDSFDFLNDYPLLERLEIYDCDIAEGLDLPRIESLIELKIVAPNALGIIKNNTHLSSLSIGTGHLRWDDEKKNIPPLTNLSGLEHFTSLSFLTVFDPVYDLSALSGCVNLRRLSLMFVTYTLETIEPILGIPRLRYLHIDHVAFPELPIEQRELFNRQKPHMPSVFHND